MGAHLLLVIGKLKQTKVSTRRVLSQHSLRLPAAREDGRHPGPLPRVEQRGGLEAPAPDCFGQEEQETYEDQVEDAHPR